MRFNKKKIKLLPISIGCMIIMFSKNIMTMNVNGQWVVVGLLFIGYGLRSCIERV